MNGPEMRIMLAAAGFAIAGMTAAPATAQVAATQVQPPGAQHWEFTIAPYIWLPTIRADLNYTTKRGKGVSQYISQGINDYISDLNFAAFLGGEARYGRFTLMTDGFFTSLSMTNSTTHLKTINLGPGPVDIPRQQQLSSGTRMNMGVWDLAGGYTVVQEGWGNVDLIGGMRLLALGSKTNLTLTNDILLPDRTVALSRDASLGVGANYVDAIVGVRGQFDIPNSRFYIPFYFDVGSGGIPLTWQAYAAVAYRISFADLSIGYRWLEFSQNGNRSVGYLSLGGALLAAKFRF